MTSKTNCHAAVINARLGRPFWLVHAQNAAPQHWSRCLPKGRSLSRAYTHTKAAGLPHFLTRDATWHDESKDRRQQSVTGNIFLRFCFVYFWRGAHCFLHRIKKGTISLFCRHCWSTINDCLPMFNIGDLIFAECFHYHLHNLINSIL